MVRPSIVFVPATSVFKIQPLSSPRATRRLILISCSSLWRLKLLTPPPDSHRISSLSFSRKCIYMRPNHSLRLPTFYFFPPWSERNVYRCLRWAKLQPSRGDGALSSCFSFREPFAATEACGVRRARGGTDVEPECTIVLLCRWGTRMSPFLSFTQYLTFYLRKCSFGGH